MEKYPVKVRGVVDVIKSETAKKYGWPTDWQIRVKITDYVMQDQQKTLNWRM